MARPPTHNPLIRSATVLQALAAAITLLSLGGMSAYASTHVRNTAAPLQPPAQSAAPSTTSSIGRLQLSRGVAITTARPVTITRRS